MSETNPLTIKVIILHLRSLDIQLTVNGDRLPINAPKGAMTPALRHQLRQGKAELLGFLQKANLPDAAILPMVPVPRKQELPLSFAQQRLWILQQMEEDSAAYNIFDAWHITGPLDIAALGQAMIEIVSRHEVLRTTCRVVDGRTSQVIAPPPHLSKGSPILSIVDLEPRRGAAMRHDRFTQAVYNLMAQEAQYDFYLTKGPALTPNPSPNTSFLSTCFGRRTSGSLMRVKLLPFTQSVRGDATEHVLLITMHHIIYDGWSTALFMNELTTLYSIKPS